MIVEVNFFENPDQEKFIKELWEKYKWVLPKWVENVYIESYLNDESNIRSNILIRYEYKSIFIKVFSSFFSGSLEEQERFFIHELAHTLCEPLAFWSKKIINQISSKELKEFLLEEYQEKVEEFVTTMEIMLDDKQKDYQPTLEDFSKERKRSL